MTERLLALAVVAASGAYLLSALALPSGTPARPGPGFFPLAIGAFGAVMALVWTASAFRRSPTTALDHGTAVEGFGRVVATAGALVGFCVLLSWVGYPVAALVFVVVLLRWLGAGWRSALVIGVASAATSYYLFGVLLDVPLPRGILLD
ncbi:MAG TPA: tripartite tricarboxylate transporter TctB family protein [Candidatus Deferrimicrobiaceae bacterium]|nr:tripartite tricarboxylate transporter TctB family protein [Candidatus Deferrimicrobiaceae bacterium]